MILRVNFGPLVSFEHWKKCSVTSRPGGASGARLLTGGARLTGGGLAHGAYVAPTVFTDCRDTMRIVREEIFGPVMAVLEFSDEDEVIAPRQCDRLRAGRGRIQ